MYVKAVRGLAIGLLAVSGLGILAMTVLVTVDVILRAVGYPLKGVYDWVQLLGAVIIAAALPYTTAIKGHVAIEYFFQKLGRRGRIAVDTVMRLLSIALFGFFAWQSVQYGLQLKRTNQVTPTIQIPVFWVPFVIGFSCAVVMLVIVHHLVRPGKEMIKP